MEQAVTSLLDGNILSNSLIKPTIIKDVLLLSPGIWTGVDGQPTRYTVESIRNGFLNSNWDAMNLFLDHKDVKESAVAYWIGFIKNARLEGGELKGDLEIWHPLISMFIEKAKARFGVSANMSGVEDFSVSQDFSDYKINNFKSMSLVDDPGCKGSWLPKLLSQCSKGDKKVFGGLIDNSKVKVLSNSVPNTESNVLEITPTPENNTLQTEENSHSEKDLENCKEVNKMEEKEKKLENKSSEKTEESETPKVVTPVDEEPSKVQDSEEVKTLSAKFDKLSESVSTLSESIKTLSAEKEKTEEVKTETEKPKEEDSKEEDSEEVKTELEETKKELAALKEELNSPDRKTLASSGNAEHNVTDANAGMLSLLRESANIPIY